MDFDLFESEDDFVLSAMCLDPTSADRPNIEFPEFDCRREDSIENVEFSQTSFVRNKFLISNNSSTTQNIELASYKFDENSLQSNNIWRFVLGRCRMNIQSLAMQSKLSKNTDSVTPYQMRRQVTLFLHLIRRSQDPLSTETFKDLENLTVLLNRIISQDAMKHIYRAHSLVGNENEIPAYHLLHGFLEWRIIDLVIRNEYKSKDGQKDNSYQTQYGQILKDLLEISYLQFKKKNLTDLMSVSPFSCVCVKETWLFLQLIEEKEGNQNKFWELFNKAVIKSDSNLSADFVPEFLIWILRSLVKIQGFSSSGSYMGPTYHRVKENYTLVETIIDCLLASEPAEEKLRIFLCILSTIVLDWWSPKLAIVMSLWEYFHKKLSSTFFTSGSLLSNLAITSSSGKGYLEKTKLLLESEAPDVNQSSFSIFTFILGRTVQQFVRMGQSNQTNKILSRIYSKFTTSKLLTLSETGIHHLIELFLILAQSGDLAELSGKLKDKLLSIELKNVSLNRQLCLVKGHTALMILFSENNIDISEYGQNVLGQIDVIKNEVSVLKILADALPSILGSARQYDGGEYLLIDSWLLVYLNSSLPVEQERLLETIHNIFDRFQSSAGNMESQTVSQNILKSLTQNVFPYVKQSFSTSFSNWLPQLAADFCIVAETNAFMKYLSVFIESDCQNKQAIPKFLLAILNSPRANMIGPSVIIQIWLKFSVLLSSKNEDVKNLTALVASLKDFDLTTELKSDEILNCKEPLCVFISAVGRVYNNCMNDMKKNTIAEKFNGYICLFDKWLTNKNEKPEVVTRFYSFIAIVIFNCSEIVYTRSKVTCFFHIAITRYIIPMAVQTGKTPEPNLTQMVHKVWPVIVQGIGKLNYKSDPYLNKTLIDLIIKWTPYFKISSNSKLVSRPFINCISADNEDLAGFILEKLTTNFIAMQRRQSSKFSSLVITIFGEIVDEIKEDDKRMKLFLKVTSLAILEHIMLADDIVPSKSLCLNLITKITHTPTYRSCRDVRHIFGEQLKFLTDKHLSFYTFFYFELLTQLVKIDKKIVENIMEYLRCQIEIVEAKRGNGSDIRLRSCFEKLKNEIS